MVIEDKRDLNHLLDSPTRTPVRSPCRSPNVRSPDVRSVIAEEEENEFEQDIEDVKLN